ncbi:MAG TPA: DNA topoisomerase IB [Thermoanaerobaculia bacterium]|nr:DNA topoisomerase IB [Thermoanaerobaculia bacterium]
MPRRSNLEQFGIRRIGTKEAGFRYESHDGRPVSAPAVLERIRALRIPPAWQDVRIARGRQSPLLAVGVDKKGRTQYLYHPRFRSEREHAKFRRVVEFGEALPKLRRRIRADLNRKGLDRERVLAAIVRLIDQGFFRVGNDKSAKSEATYGLTTVLSRHVSVDGSAIRFDYVGKWQKSHSRVVRDREIAGIIRQLSRMDGDELFKYEQGSRVFDVKDRHVNDYIQSIIGEQFTAKDFRTWAGTLLCSMALGQSHLQHGEAPTKKERKRRLKTAIELTASQLGNTPAVCRASYICPRLVDEYMDGNEIKTGRKQLRGSPVAKAGLSIEEKALLRFLRHTIADRRAREERRRTRKGASDRREG